MFYRDESCKSPTRRWRRSSRQGICPKSVVAKSLSPGQYRIWFRGQLPVRLFVRAGALDALKEYSTRLEAHFHRDSAVGAVFVIHVAAALVAQAFLGTELRCFPHDDEPQGRPRRGPRVLMEHQVVRTTARGRGAAFTAAALKGLDQVFRHYFSTFPATLL